MKSLLYITGRFPHPLDKGDKLRAFYCIKELSQLYHIHLFSLSDESIAPESLDQLSQYCKDIQLCYIPKKNSITRILKGRFKKWPHQVSYFWDATIAESLLEYYQRIQPAIVFCQLARMAPYITHTPLVYHPYKVLDYMDAFSLNARRRSNYANFFESTFFSWESSLMLDYERHVASIFEKKCIISTVDANYIGVDNIQIIANGVDQKIFSPSKVSTTVKDIDILFVGNMSYHPNIAAAEYLCKKILPQLVKKGFTLKTVIAGTDPSDKVKNLADESVTVTGYVEDITNYYARATILVAPIFQGSGLQNKLLEAMAMLVPCVTTSLINAPLQARPNDEIYIADSQEEFESSIIKLLNDPSERSRIAQNAYNFVNKKYNWADVATELTKNCLNDVG